MEEKLSSRRIAILSDARDQITNKMRDIEPNQRPLNDAYLKLDVAFDDAIMAEAKYLAFSAELKKQPI